MNQAQMTALLLQLRNFTSDLIPALLPNQGEDVERDIAISDIFYQVVDQIWMAQGEEDWHVIHDLFVDDNGQMFAITSNAGRLYQWPVRIVGDDVIVGVPVRVSITFEERRKNRQTFQLIHRERDGWLMGLAVISTTILNRSGEIDSRALFDDFKRNRTGEEYINFHHQGGETTRLGRIVDFWRSENTLIALLEFDDGPLARAAAETLANDTEGVWGFSIEFYPTEAPEMLRLAPGIKIPVYNRGLLAGVSILKERKAAAWYTQHSMVTRKAHPMNDDIFQDLLELVGEENREEAEAFAMRVDSVNRDVENDGLITRNSDENPDQDAPDESPDNAPEGAEGNDEDEEEPTPDDEDEGAQGAPEPAESVVENIELVIDEQVTDELVEQTIAQLRSSGFFESLLSPALESVQELRDEIAELRQALGKRDGDIGDLSARLDVFERRADELGRSDEEKIRETLEDLPPSNTRRVIVRPSQRNNDTPMGNGQAPVDLSERANQTLARIRNKRK